MSSFKNACSDEEFWAKLVKRMRNITWYEYRNTNICLDGVAHTDVCVRAYSLQDVFTPAGWPSLWAFHVTDRMNDRKKRGGMERETQKYREREDTLGQTDHQWPSFPQLCQWLNWSLLPDWLHVWMRCVRSQNTYRWSYFFKWISYNHVNAGRSVVIFSSLWILHIADSLKAQNDHQHDGNSVVCAFSHHCCRLCSYYVPFLKRAERFLLAYYLIYDPHHLALPILCHWNDWRVLLYPYSELKISPWPM